MAGEGFLLGGVMVMGAGDKGVVYQFREKTLGEHAPLADVLKACREAVGVVDVPAAAAAAPSS